MASVCLDPPSSSSPATTQGFIASVRRSISPYLVLDLLHRSDSYAYEIAQQLRNVDELFCPAGDLSGFLSRLEKGGLVEHEWRHGESSLPRKYFRLTPRGEARRIELRAVFAKVVASTVRIPDDE